MGKEVIDEALRAIEMVGCDLQVKLETLMLGGIDDEYVSDINKTNASLKALAAERKELKRQLRETCSQRNKAMRELCRMVCQAQKLIKKQFPKEQWKEFGISDAR